MVKKRLSQEVRNRYYEASVQTPELHATWFVEVYKKINTKKYPRILREDFCGSFAISREWVIRNRSNQAVAIDLDKEVLKYGLKKAKDTLNKNQLERIKVCKQDVRSKTSIKFDVIAACNFSFNIFKNRRDLKSYFESARKSLDKKGIFVLEVAGGPGMIEKGKERKTIRDPLYPDDPKKKFIYIWDQQEFDPITHEAKYAIHFESVNGKQYLNEFTYDWRLWTMPELRDLLSDSGFSKTAVFWETSTRGEGSGEYAMSKKGDNAYTWIAYVIGIA